jgi:hypothetical protein
MIYAPLKPVFYIYYQFSFIVSYHAYNLNVLGSKHFGYTANFNILYSKHVG